MKRDTQPHLWPTWNLSADEAERFYRGSGQVTLAVDEHSQLLGVVYHSRCETREALQSALAQMHSDFPHAVTREGSMRGHYFCEDLPDAGWRQVWEEHSPSDRSALAAYEEHCKTQGLPPTQAGRDEWLTEWRSLDEEQRQDAVDMERERVPDWPQAREESATEPQEPDIDLER